MPGTHLEAPLFIKEISESAVDIARTPFFFNDGGAPTFLDAPPAGATALTPAGTHPAMAHGQRVPAVAEVIGVKPNAAVWHWKRNSGLLPEKVAFRAAVGHAGCRGGLRHHAGGAGPGRPGEQSGRTCSRSNTSTVCSPGTGRPTREQATPCSAWCAPTWSTTTFPMCSHPPTPRQPLVISVGRYWPRLGKHPAGRPLGAARQRALHSAQTGLHQPGMHRPAQQPQLCARLLGRHPSEQHHHAHAAAKEPRIFLLVLERHRHHAWHTSRQWLSRRRHEYLSQEEPGHVRHE
jgi:hypothetical protein